MGWIWKAPNNAAGAGPGRIRSIAFTSASAAPSAGCRLGREDRYHLSQMRSEDRSEALILKKRFRKFRNRFFHIFAVGLTHVRVLQLVIAPAAPLADGVFDPMDASSVCSFKNSLRQYGAVRQDIGFLLYHRRDLPEGGEKVEPRTFPARPVRSSRTLPKKEAERTLSSGRSERGHGLAPVQRVRGGVVDPEHIGGLEEQRMSSRLFSGMDTSDPSSA